jgi:hypothetical protein
LFVYHYEKNLYRSLNRVQETRKRFKIIANQLDLNSIIFMDESHFCNKEFVRRFGRSFKSFKPYSLFHRLSKDSFSLICSITKEGVVYYEIYLTNGHGVKGENIYRYFKNFYFYYNENQLLLLDNASVHCINKVTDLFENLNIKYINISPYSPDLEHFMGMGIPGYCKIPLIPLIPG